MRKSLTFSMIAVLLVGYSNQGFAKRSGASQDLEPAEYAVYAVVLDEKKNRTQLVIDEYTRIADLSNSDSQRILEQLAPLTKETYEDFVAKNEKPSKLTNEFNLKAEIKFLGKEDEVPQDRTKDPWEAFHQKYRAGAIHTLSRVGFNKDKTQALVFVAFICGGLCGEGNYFLLTKNEGQWKIEKKLFAWIS
jgi:hypothetical protein